MKLDAEVATGRFSRRFFIGGALALGAFGGGRVLALPGGASGRGKPKLTFGVISDIHIRRLARPGDQAVAPAASVEEWGNTITFRHTLEWFRDQGVEAVVIAGDMADWGLVEQLQAVAEVWYAVFPDDRLPDGRKVEKVFVYGNHDWLAWKVNPVLKKYGSREEAFKHALANDFAGHWRRIFHEDYQPIYRKTVNGYSFVGQHWDGVSEKQQLAFDRIGPFMAENGAKLDPAQPFFYVQHPHLRNTCYGPWAWGHDAGKVTAVLAGHPNAVAFSGHSHYTLTDERSIWQGAFTSVGTGSLRFTGEPWDEYLPAGFENSQANYGNARRKYDSRKLMPLIYMDDSRQGMLWKVYDDCMVVRRREFVADLDLGRDWVVPLPASEPRPFAFAEHAKKFRPPAFPEGAQLKITPTVVRRRGLAARQPGARGFRVDIPAAVPDPVARVYRFIVEAKGWNLPDVRRKIVLAEGYNHAPAAQKAVKPSWCAFSKAELPAGMVQVTVTPENCFHHQGRPLVADFENA